MPAIDHNKDIIPADHFVTTHVIGESYHVVWASQRGMIWKLKSMSNGTAYLETPKTKRPMTAKIDDLREVNRNVLKNCKKRLEKKQVSNV